MAIDDGYDSQPSGLETETDALPIIEDVDALLDEQPDDTSDEENTYTIMDSIGQQNICDFFSDQKLDEIGQQCMRDFEVDETDFSTRKARIEELYKLALQAIEQKDYPFPNASNIKYPLLTKAALAFASLAYPAIVKDDQVVKGKVIGNDDGDAPVLSPEGKPIIDPETGKEVRKNAGAKLRRAQRVGNFMSHQVLEEMEGWEDDMDKLLHIIPIIGCSFKKAFYDPAQGQNVSNLVLPQYLIADTNAKTTAGANRLSELLDLYPNEIEENIRSGIFRAFDYHTQNTETLKEQYASGQDGAAAIASSADDDKPHLFIEIHRRLDLDGDDYAEPYIVWIHKATGKVARILPRFDRLGIKQDKEGGIIRIKPECYYEKFPFIPDPEGSLYDIGFGHLLQHLNEAANTSINQMIDAGHRYIMGGGFIGKGLRIKGGDVKFKPGEFKRADSGGMSLRENVVPLPMPEPSAVLMALMQFLITAAEDMSVMTKALSGEFPANMPATTALASIEQGLQPFKAVFKRIHRALKREFKRLFYLNQKYLTQEEYARVLDDQEADVEKDFITDTIDILPMSDPEMVSNMQDMIRAQALSEMKDDPLMDGIEIRRRMLKAWKIKDGDSLVKIPPPVQDELVEAQKAALQAQIDQSNAAIDKMNRDNERADIETALNIEKGMAEIMLKTAQAVKAIADAEAAEDGTQLQVYKTQLEQLNQRMGQYAAAADTRNFSRGNRPVEVKPDNREVSQVPA